MVLKKKILSAILEEADNGGFQPVPQSPHSIQESVEPAAAPQPVQPVITAGPQASGWQYHLAAAITQMPEEMATKLLSCLPKDFIIEMLKSRSNDPLMKLALLLLQRNV
ncbi:hypothetical protein PAE2400 [Pyrobaculum aerophilum str. IM2]|uniref:Uncharacterized protein n=2 Tax=Pyrobaculum aerophilum TaxID=13773 RepID=Q8ZV89_PYRAE|nr:hypothetical protein [Pyrobaculum aerophilum]AAL64167.1 hypothetical protein PAE2400 [Pyrobaculum aerophilum str. IM2]HII47072.1 hypothetical protein [Pyrobaculum aerophilum]